MSSSGSSFLSISDLCDSVMSVSRLEKELKDVKVENAGLKSLVQELTEKVKESTVEPEENILTAIVGSWNIISSVGMEEYLERLNPPDIANAIFQVGSQSYECDGDSVTETWAIGNKTSKTTCKIGEKKQQMMLIIDDNMLVTVYFQENGEECARVERFVKKGRLHTVTKKFGMKCTRIYEKVGAEKTKNLERIAELESELEKLKLEKMKFQAKLDEKDELIEVLGNDIDEIFSDMEALEDEKAKIEEELKKEREGVEVISAKLDTQMNIAMDKKKEVEDQLAENEVLKKRLEEMEKKLKIANMKLEKVGAEKRIDQPAVSPIVGKWKLYKACTPTLVFEWAIDGGYLVETKTYGLVQDVKLFGLNNPFQKNGTLYEHTTWKENGFITKYTRIRDGSFHFSIDRSVEQNLMTETVKYEKYENKRVYERIE